MSAYIYIYLLLYYIQCKASNGVGTLTLWWDFFITIVSSTPCHGLYVTPLHYNHYTDHSSNSNNANKNSKPWSFKINPILRTMCSLIRRIWYHINLDFSKVLVKFLQPYYMWITHKRSTIILHWYIFHSKITAISVRTAFSITWFQFPIFLRKVSSTRDIELVVVTIATCTLIVGSYKTPFKNRSIDLSRNRTV